MSNQNQNISWEAHEFQFYAKNPGWYITLISITILVVAFFIIVQSDWFAAVCMAIISLLIIYFSRQTPGLVKIELTDQGIKFGNLFYPYKQLKYFWIVNNDNHRTVNFHTTALLNSTLILELENEDPNFIRTYLLNFLPEHSKTEETAAQRIMHRFKF